MILELRTTAPSICHGALHLVELLVVIATIAGLRVLLVPTITMVILN